MRTNSLLVALVFLATPLAGHAQEFARRIAAAGPEATVRFDFPARPGVCGLGGGMISVHRQDRPGRIALYRGNGGFSMYDGDADSDEWEGDCQHGPVRVALDLQEGSPVAARTYVAGRWVPAAGVVDLGMVGGQEAADYLLRVLAPHAARRVARTAILAGSLAADASVWPALLDLARGGRGAKDLRGEAMQWLVAPVAANLEGPPGATRDTADLEVRKQALFAISQRSKSESIPALIQVARTGADPELRRTAVFWLAQTGDDRALDFFEEVLRRR